MPPSKNKRSRKQEEAGARRLGGRRVAGSGNGWATKNDVKTHDLSIEFKYTDKNSFRLEHEDLIKAERQAVMDGGREFAFVVGFGKLKGVRSLLADEYVVISRGYFEALRGDTI